MLKTNRMNKFFLNLGLQPLANNYLSNFKVKQKKYNLNLVFNTQTKLVSISKRIPSKEMFNDKYPYRSSISQTMTNSFQKLSIEIKKRFSPKLLLEIGSNDGALIRNFSKSKVIGVEPCSNLANITKKKGYKTYNNYWDYNLAKKIKKEFNTIDLIYSANTLTHISNLNEVFSSISTLLSNDGVLIIEDPSLLECIKKNAYDQFYNEHIYVFSALSLKNILKKYNLVIFDLDNIKTHGGSTRYYIKKNTNKKLDIKKSVKKQIIKEIKFRLNKFTTCKKFAINVKRSKHILCKLLKEIKQKNKTIIGYGATAKSTTILNFCNIDNKTIKYFVDTTPNKKNKFLPGTNIKILKYNKKYLNKIDYVYLGAWNFKDEIFKKEKSFIKKGGKFITHVPQPRIIKIK